MAPMPKTNLASKLDDDGRAEGTHREIRPLPAPDTLSDSQLDRELLTLRLDVHADKLRALMLLEEYRRRQRMCELN